MKLWSFLKKTEMKVLFNASVILAGLYSPSGASGTLLKILKRGSIKGVISELILNEALRHADKIHINQKVMLEKIISIFGKPITAPDAATVEKYTRIVIDEGDAHVLASTEEGKCDILVTLDKKHLLILKGKIKSLRIMSPGELLTFIQ